MPTKSKLPIVPQGNLSKDTEIVGPDIVFGIASTPGYHEIPIDMIRRSPYNPRQIFVESEIDELALTLIEHGLLQPIVVRPIFDDIMFEVVAGERRFRAAQRAWSDHVETRIPCMVRVIDDNKAKILANLENLQRTELTALEEARGISNLVEAGMTQAEISAALGVTPATVSKKIGLLDLPFEVMQYISEGRLTPSHGVRLQSYGKFEKVQIALAKTAVEKRWNVRAVESPLPWETSRSLFDQHVARELGGYHIAFDWKTICPNCPYEAFRKTDYSQGVCLNPPHYDQLQREVKKTKARAEKEAADLATAVARQELPMVRNAIASGIGDRAGIGHPITGATPTASPSGPPKLGDLKNCRVLGTKQGIEAAYKHGEQICEIPDGCSQDCNCRGAALDMNGKQVSICTDGKRFDELRTKQKESLAEAKRLAIAGRLQAAEEYVRDQSRAEPDGVFMQALFRQIAIRQFPSKYVSPTDRIQIVNEAMVLLGIEVDPDDFRPNNANGMAPEKTLATLTTTQICAWGSILRMHEETDYVLKGWGRGTDLIDFVERVAPDRAAYVDQADA